jgi:Tfp pilus assembly protein PilN
MITVNLLPPEYRRRDRTPLRVFGALVGGVVLTTSIGVYYANTHFGELASVEAALTEINNEFTDLSPQIGHHDSLVREKADYKARADTIHLISSSRISWTKKIDELIDIVNAGEPRDVGGDGYLVWFDKLSIQQDPLAAAGKRKRRKGASTMAGSCDVAGKCASRHMSSVTHFLGDLQTNEEFYRIFGPIEDPRSQLDESSDERLEPSHVLTFPIKMGIKIMKPAIATGKKR